MADTTEGARHITLDRTNLLRMAQVLRSGCPTVARVGFIDGWLAASDVLAMIAAEMPDLYGDEGFPVKH